MKDGQGEELRFQVPTGILIINSCETDESKISEWSSLLISIHSSIYSSSHPYIHAYSCNIYS